MIKNKINYKINNNTLDIGFKKSVRILTLSLHFPEVILSPLERNKLTIEYEGSGITQPKIIHCKNFEEMVTHAGNHRQQSKKVLLNSKNRL